MLAADSELAGLNPGRCPDGLATKARAELLEPSWQQLRRRYPAVG